MSGGRRKGITAARRYGLAAVVAVSVFAADQISKALISRRLLPGELVVVIPHVLNFTRAHNTGGVFSLFPNKPFLFAALSFVAIAFLSYLFVKLEGRSAARFAAAAVMGGALGNLADRLRLGYVVDFIDMHWGPWHWYVYNVADAGITVGALALFAITLWDERPKYRSARGLPRREELPPTEAIPKE